MPRPRIPDGQAGELTVRETAAGAKAVAYIRDGEHLRRMTATAGTAQDAERMLRVRLGMRAAGHSPDITHATPLGELATGYLAALEHEASPSKFREHRRVLTHHLGPMALASVGQLTLQDVEEHLGVLGVQAPATAKALRIALRAVLGLAQDAGAIRRVPVGRDPLPRPEPPARRAMSRLELAQALAAVRAWQDEPTVGRPRVRNLDVHLALYVTPGVSGAAMALGACWEDIDLDRAAWITPTGVLRLPAAVVQVLAEHWEGQGRPERGLVAPSSTGREVSPQKLSDRLLAALGPSWRWVTAGCLASSD
ncbi:hypothetical protein [Sinomonas halotolerans]|uniref:Core-binding (CB) domain-containing protein n=1 Tax=Sinomonas halotolerans TaxID=1644133 RepID=A0ABU9WW40_9MICC